MCFSEPWDQVLPITHDLEANRHKTVEWWQVGAVPATGTEAISLLLAEGVKRGAGEVLLTFA